MRITLLTAALLLALVAVETEAFNFWGRSGRRSRAEVTCSQVKTQEVCDGTNSGFSVFDGCNACTCGSQAGKLTCSLKSCPREDELTDPRLKRKAARYCAKMVRKLQKRLRKFQKKTGGSSSAGASSDQRWPIKCFKERKLCRERPGVAFFDGCNSCRCPEQPAAAAQCETTNVCPEFAGSRREFKQRCRALGARIEGGSGEAAGGGQRGGGRKRNQRKRPAEEEETTGFMQRMLSQF